MTLTKYTRSIRKSPIKVGLIGYGKFGKQVAQQLSGITGISIEWVAKRTIPAKFEGNPGIPIYAAASLANGALIDFHPVDVLIDTSVPQAIHGYGLPAAARNIKIITAVQNYPESTRQILNSLAKQTVILLLSDAGVATGYLHLASLLLGNPLSLAGKAAKENLYQKTDPPTRANALRINSDDVVLPIDATLRKLLADPRDALMFLEQANLNHFLRDGILLSLRHLDHHANGLFNYDELIQKAIAATLTNRHVTQTPA